MPRKKKPDEFVDYFASDEHEKTLGATFAEIFHGAVDTATKEVGDDVNRPPGLFRAISKMQGAAAGAAHFYRVSGLRQQGAAYFRGLADQIESADQPDTPVS